jgi:hypothetical protein
VSRAIVCEERRALFSACYPFPDGVLGPHEGRTKEVLERRYGLTGKQRWTQRRVAAVFAISVGRVQQIETKAYYTLKRWKLDWEAKVPKQVIATEPYRPSNGSEGDEFASVFCEFCARELANRPAEDARGLSFFRAKHPGGCPILTATYGHDVDESGYPAEWVRDTGGGVEAFATSRCTGFVPDGVAFSRRAEEIMRRTPVARDCSAGLAEAERLVENLMLERGKHELLVWLLDALRAKRKDL